MTQTNVIDLQLARLKRGSQSTVTTTITEKQLFEIFVGMTFGQYVSCGGAKERLATYEYVPMDYLLDYGIYGVFEGVADLLFDRLACSDDTGIELDCVIEDLEAYLLNLRRVRDDFSSFKSIHHVDAGEEPADPEKLEVWQAAQEENDSNPRFYAPDVGSSEGRAR